jgi:leader peptidase (prepilin peptidase) / N-methyltransferase
MNLWFPQWSWLLALCIGAAVGSFLNMLIYRLPRRLSFSNPRRSFCPECRHSLAVIDLFPLFSWLSTGGKCRYCRKPIAVRYFLVEVLVGGLYAGLWHRYLIASFEPVRMGFYMLAAAALVAIIFIDWELFIIPDQINVFLLVVGLGYGAATHRMIPALHGALTGWAILWGVALLGRLLFRKDAMGHGDIKMMRGVGALIGPALTVANMAIAVMAALVIGIAVIVASRKDKSEDAPAHDKFPAPESIGSLLKFGAFYLLCLDCVGVVWHGIYRLIGEGYQEVNIEDDTWKPSLTTIPFGPYLAAGALACMLFATPLDKAIDEYWQSVTYTEIRSQINHLGRFRNSAIPAGYETTRIAGLPDDSSYMVRCRVTDDRAMLCR